jgi:hypothetical protein
MKATKSEALLNCAQWNYEKANIAHKKGEDKRADRLEEQAESLYHQALKRAD